MALPKRLKKFKLFLQAVPKLYTAARVSRNHAEAITFGYAIGQKLKQDWEDVDNEDKVEAKKEEVLPPDPLEPPPHHTSKEDDYKPEPMEGRPYCQDCSRQMLVQGKGLMPTGTGSAGVVFIFLCPHCGTMCFNLAYQAVDEKEKKMVLRHMTAWTNPARKKEFFKRQQEAEKAKPPVSSEDKKDDDAKLHN